MTTISVKIGDLVSVVGEVNPPEQATILSVSERFGIVPQSTIFQKKIATDDLSKYKQVRYGDIVFNPYLLWNRAVGVCFEKDGGCVSPAYVVLRPRSEGTKRFLHYFFRSEEFTSSVDRLASGSVTRRRTAPLRDILNLGFVIPGIDSQKAISSVLTLIDNRIELNSGITKTLETIAHAIFKSWFVDFDPVRAKMDGRQPIGMDAETAELFPDSFEDSELGKIPKGWNASDIYSISDVIYGAPFKSNLFNERNEGIPLIRIRDLASHDPVVFTTERHPRGYIVQPGDLVVGMDREFRAYLWKGPESWLNQRVCCFKPKPDVPQAFVHYSIESLLDFFERSKTGTTVIHLGKRDIDTFAVVVPPESILKSFAASVEPMEARMVVGAMENRSLATIRDTLLPKLISGKVRVKDAERFVEEHAG